MNFSWLSRGDERRMRDRGDGSSLLLTHQREVHRLQSLSMKPDRRDCFNYPALSSIPLSIKKGLSRVVGQGREGRRGVDIMDIIGSTFFFFFFCPPTLRGSDVTLIVLIQTTSSCHCNTSATCVLFGDFSLKSTQCDDVRSSSRPL